MTRKAPALRIALLASALAMCAGPCLAESLSIVKEADLEFGRFAASAVLPARVTIGTDGARSTDNGVLLAGAGPQPAQFTVSGDSNSAFQASISLGATGLAGVSLQSLTATCGVGSTFSSGILSGCQLSVSGTATVRVGGTLVVDAGRSTTSLSALNAITVQVSN